MLIGMYRWLRGMWFMSQLGYTVNAKIFQRRIFVRWAIICVISIVRNVVWMKKGFFDFKAGLKRMNDAANKTVGHFKAACISEKLHHVIRRRHRARSQLQTLLQSDLYAQKILDQHGGTSRKPVHTKGDDSCLFHAASIGMSGFDNVSDQLRYFSAIELGINADTYQKQFLEKISFMFMMTMVKLRNESPSLIAGAERGHSWLCRP